MTDSKLLSYFPFPDVSNANADGLLATGGDLSPDMLVSAYKQGIFPWYNRGQPILWWSPNPRMVLYPEQVKVSRSLKKTLRKQPFSFSMNRAFEEVVRACADRPKIGSSPSTWITLDMFNAYSTLHQLGYAHSLEVWLNQELVGGLYGVRLGHVFFGESMFSRVTDSSKCALIALCRWSQHIGIDLIDCQVANDHLVSLGAIDINRDKFLSYLTEIDINLPSPESAQSFEHFLQDSAITLI